MLRQEVRDLVALGILPDELADAKLIDLHADLLERIASPVTDEEACLLVKLFGPDDCFGVAWTLVHHIETAPSWPLAECLLDDKNEWVDRLRRRAANADSEERE